LSLAPVLHVTESTRDNVGGGRDTLTKCNNDAAGRGCAYLCGGVDYA